MQTLESNRTGPAGLASVLILASLASIGYAQGEDGDSAPRYIFSVTAYSDLYQPVSGAPYSVFSFNHGDHEGLTETEGQSAFHEMSAGESLLVTLGEVSVPLGVALGQRRVATMPSYASPSDENYLELEMTQPLAMPFTWLSSDGSVPASVQPLPFHDRWGLEYTLDSELFGANIDFSGHIAPLLTRDVIDAFAWYNEIAFGSSDDDFRLGVLMRTGEVDVPVGSFTLRVDCRGHGFVAPPIASCFIVRYEDDGSLPPPTLSANVVQWHNEQAYIFVEGTLENADNVILLSSAYPALPTERLLATPPYPSGSTDGGGPTTCEPQPPGPPAGWSCNPPAPPQQPPCKAAVKVGNTICGTSNKKVSEDRCGSGGDQKSVTTEKQAAGGISVTANVGPLEVEITGEFSGSKSETLTLVCNDGEHDCGECKAEFQQRLVCQATWDYEKRSMWIPHPNSMREITFTCDKHQKKTSCVETKSVTGKCSMTCD